jgi:hypothetical protein
MWFLIITLRPHLATITVKEQLCLKGRRHEMVIFVEGLHVNILISTLCVSADGLQGLPKGIQFAIQLYPFISICRGRAFSALISS